VLASRPPGFTAHVLDVTPPDVMRLAVTVDAPEAKRFGVVLEG
jgi:hypothetical protein